MLKGAETDKGRNLSIIIAVAIMIFTAIPDALLGGDFTSAADSVVSFAGKTTDVTVSLADTYKLWI